MVELMVTLVVVLVVIAAASTAYLQLFGSFKVQGKISETQMDTLCGFGLLRYDVEMAGYGLPFDMNSLTYSEAASDPLLLNDANATISTPPGRSLFQITAVSAAPMFWQSNPSLPALTAPRRSGRSCIWREETARSGPGAAVS